MPWFWGSSKDNDESSYEEYTDEEYDDGDEYYTDDDDEEYHSDDEKDGDSSGVLVEKPKKDTDSNNPANENDVKETVDVPQKKKDNDSSSSSSIIDNEKVESSKINNSDNDDDIPKADGDSTTDYPTKEEEDDDDDEEWVPDHVGGIPRRRQRAPSALTVESVDDDGSSDQNTVSSEILRKENELYQTKKEEGGEEQTNNSQNGEKGSHRDDDEEEEEEEEEEAATTTIEEKQSLLVLAAEHDRVDIINSILNNEEADKDLLLAGNGDIPPLHIAVSFGSTGTVQCLLRLGADPSLRPEKKSQMSPSPVEIPHRHKFFGKSAWELMDDCAKTAKRQAMEHGFTAEALRCLGGDEVDRLRQLITAGMSADMDISGKTLQEWAVTMEAPGCMDLLAPPTSAKDDSAPLSASRVLDRPDETVSSLRNQLQELQDLSRALSTCVDELAEEASVCTGLLMQGGGAAALATHVRSLKHQLEEKRDHLDSLKEDYETVQDELAYWVHQCGGEDPPSAEKTREGGTEDGEQEATAASSEDKGGEVDALRNQIETTEANIRKLRASMIDLGDANARDYAQVEARGLQGGLKLARNLREELKTLNSDIAQLETAIPACREEIERWSAQVANKPRSAGVSNNQGAAVKVSGETSSQGDVSVSSSEEKDQKNLERLSSRPAPIDSTLPSSPLAESYKIATGQSTALALRNDARGFFPLSLWEILLRIIGIRDTTVPTRTGSAPPSGNRQPAMII